MKISEIENITGKSVFWCDRCGRTIIKNDERDHGHASNAFAVVNINPSIPIGGIVSITNRFTADG